MHELVQLSAVEQRKLIQDKKVSAIELLEAHQSHIESVNPRINAIVSHTPEIAHTAAKRVDAAIARGDDPGLLAGLPTVHKDLFETDGIRTTWGSTLFENHVPDRNTLIVQRQIDAGAVTLGKSNTPEWGAGSNTFNDIFGKTGNPYDLGKTCGGSSGGAGAALAARMVPIADGSDMGGSLRNPGNFNNVVGFRTSPGRVPAHPSPMAWSNLGIHGPMARTVKDCALFLAAIAGPDDRVPISLPEAGNTFLETLKKNVKGTRVAVASDFSGQLPVESVVKNIVADALPLLESMGCDVSEDCPDFSGADDVFKTLRAWGFAATHGVRVREHRDKYKATLIWNVEAGLSLRAQDIADAETQRTLIYQRVIAFFENVDFLVLPVSQVPPFPIDVEYPTEVDGTEMLTYIDWMKSCYYITITGLPALSLPFGFTPDGLPVGIQIVCRPQQELELLKFANAIEEARPTWKQLPRLN
ncbi:MAG: amidase [Pseudomonadales bacterium]|nr:amidase [Pseudomonadales bacterium]